MSSSTPSTELTPSSGQTGEKEETLKYLEAAYREHTPFLITIQNEPVFDFLHIDPRYRALVTKLGLQPAY